MKNKVWFMKKVVAFLLAITLLGVSVSIDVNAANTVWRICEDTGIYWVSTQDSSMEDERLKEQIQLFDSELEAATGNVCQITFGEQVYAGENDIVLILDSVLGIAEQGYKVTLSGNQLVVSASDEDGLFYGCRYVIQQLLLNDSVSEANEAPDVLERAVSLDNGRKYFSVEWIKQFIREMSWSNMNALALHFSEEMGLGIESKLYPWLAGRDGVLCTQAEVSTDNRYLTQEEIKEIVEYADLYHVEIIPSFDSPGHMNYVVKKFNEKCATEDYTFTYDGKTYTAKAGSEIGNYYHYNGETSIVKGSRNPDYSRGIDISNEVAVAFTRSLVEEYATLFAELGCTKFDIGGDELLGWGSAVVSTSKASRWQQLDHWKEYAQNRAKAEGKSNWADAVAYDGFMYYMNDLNDLVRELEYTSVRMWNDDALRSSDTGWSGVVQLDTDIDIWFWTTGTNTVWTYATAGYQVYNILSDYNYYAMTTDYFSSNRGSFTQSYPDQIYNEWTPFTFDPSSTVLGTGKNTAIGNPNVLGSALGVWCDNPTLRSEADVMEDLLPLVRAHGVKAWDALANESVSYDTFTANVDIIGNAPSELPEASEVKEYIPVDVTELEMLISEFENTDSDLYTEESFMAYSNKVQAAKTLLGTSDYTQEEVDAACDAIRNAKEQLKSSSSLNSNLKLYEAKFKSASVAKGRTATLSIIADTEVVGFIIYDNDGNKVTIKKQQKMNTKTGIEGTVYTCIQFVENTKGTRTYTIYGIDENGNRSVDSVQASLKVK